MGLHTTINRVPTHSDSIGVGLDNYGTMTAVEVSRKAFDHQVDGNYWPADCNYAIFS
ncbi:MAG TPA: hypothetical protein VGI19_10430 [Candidatus Cybelea sp.]